MSAQPSLRGSEATKQSIVSLCGAMDCFAIRWARNDGSGMYGWHGAKRSFALPSRALIRATLCRLDLLWCRGFVIGELSNSIKIKGLAGC